MYVLCMHLFAYWDKLQTILQSFSLLKKEPGAKDCGLTPLHREKGRYLCACAVNTVLQDEVRSRHTAEEGRVLPLATGSGHNLNKYIFFYARCPPLNCLQIGYTKKPFCPVVITLGQTCRQKQKVHDSDFFFFYFFFFLEFICFLGALNSVHLTLVHALIPFSTEPQTVSDQYLFIYLVSYNYCTLVTSMQHLLQCDICTNYFESIAQPTMLFILTTEKLFLNKNRFTNNDGSNLLDQNQ